MAKCDVCGKETTGTLFKCEDCNTVFCLPCTIGEPPICDEPMEMPQPLCPKYGSDHWVRLKS